MPLDPGDYPWLYWMKCREVYADPTPGPNVMSVGGEDLFLDHTIPAEPESD